MTTPSDDRTPVDDDRTPDPSSSRPDEAAGVELGMSEGGGGTFEPEEDVAPER
jgi:hypothetical protein